MSDEKGHLTEEELERYRESTMKDWNITNFNSIRNDLINHLHGCGEVNGTIYWYNGTIRLLLEMVKFIAPETVHKTFAEIMGVDTDE